MSNVLGDQLDKAVKLVHITTIPESLAFFLRGQANYMRHQGLEVHGIASPGEALHQAALQEGMIVHGIEMQRYITPLKDLVALGKLYRLIRQLKPTIVHAHTPKAGFLGVLAARLAGVPVVIYGMRGLRFITSNGIRRKLLMLSETLACQMAHQVIAVSFSIKKRALALGLCQPEKIQVIKFGSGNGVDAKVKFNPQRLPTGTREVIRERYQIPKEAVVLGFVGRIVKDKGIMELTEAWQALTNEFPDLFLILIGQEEPQDPVPRAILDRLKTTPKVRFLGCLREMASAYAAMDILVLPTYREGFPNVLLEAAAMELPVVATHADGSVDAVIDEVTGFLVPPQNGPALAVVLRQLLLNQELREQMGKAGRQRVLHDYRPESIWQALFQNYMELLKTKHPISLIAQHSPLQKYP